MNKLTPIPNSTSPGDDQTDHGFYIHNGKYFLNEYRNRDCSVKELSNFVMQIEFHLSIVRSKLSYLSDLQ